MEVVESESYVDTSNVGNASTIQEILEPYSKTEIIEFMTNAAIKNPNLYTLIQSTAKQDVAHRQIFVYGLGWDTTTDDLRSTFDPFGEIEDCVLVSDRATGKAKGYAFVLFKTRRGAANALKQPKKQISNRLTSCQLASLGSASANSGNDSSGRKIYVSSVQHDVDPSRLRAFFEKFGEIEVGPLGFDFQTGKSRGFALFLYKTNDGAMKALAEPCKIFEGHQLHCRLAMEGKNRLNVQPPLSSSLSSAQNLLLNACTGLNPLYGGITASQAAIAANKAADQSQALLAVNQSQALLAANQNPALQASNQSQALLAANHSQALLAANQSQALLAAKQSQALLAAKQSQALLAAKQSQALLAAKQSQALLAANQSQALLAANQRQALLAANQSQALLAANQSQALLAANQRQALLSANQSQALLAAGSLNPLAAPGGLSAQNMLSPNKFVSQTGDMVSTSIRSGVGLTRYGAAGSLDQGSQHGYPNVQKNVYPYSQHAYENGQLRRPSSGGGQGAGGYFSTFPTYT